MTILYVLLKPPIIPQIWGTILFLNSQGSGGHVQELNQNKANKSRQGAGKNPKPNKAKSKTIGTNIKENAGK